MVWTDACDGCCARDRPGGAPRAVASAARAGPADRAGGRRHHVPRGRCPAQLHASSTASARPSPRLTSSSSPFEVDPERLAELRAEPSIEAAAPLAVVFAKVQGSDTDIVNESQVRVAVDGRYGVDVDRGRILAGTPLDHDDPHAVEISESVAAEHGLGPWRSPRARDPHRAADRHEHLRRDARPGRPRGPCSSWSCNRWCGRPPRPSGCPIRAPSCSPVRCGSRSGEPVPLDASTTSTPARLGRLRQRAARARPPTAAPPERSRRLVGSGRTTTSCSWRRARRRRPGSPT